MVQFQVFPVLMKTRDMFHNNIHPKAQSTVTLFDILSHGFKSKFRQSSVFSAFAAAMKPDRPPVTHHFPQTPQTFSLISFPQMEERATKTSNEKRASDKC